MNLLENSKIAINEFSTKEEFKNLPILIPLPSSFHFEENLENQFNDQESEMSRGKYFSERAEVISGHSLRLLRQSFYFLPKKM